MMSKPIVEQDEQAEPRHTAAAKRDLLGAAAFGDPVGRGGSRCLARRRRSSTP
jgi:hypothetical protein